MTRVAASLSLVSLLLGIVGPTRSVDLRGSRQQELFRSSKGTRFTQETEADAAADTTCPCDVNESGGGGSSGMSAAEEEREVTKVRMIAVGGDGHYLNFVPVSCVT